MNRKINTKLGFSLLELSLSLIIIAVLIIGVSAGSRALSKARLTSAQSLTKSSPVTSIGDLLVWYESTMENSFNDSDVTSNLINTWNNIGINSNAGANNAVAPTSASAPIYTKNIINGLPALYFNGADAVPGNRDYFTFDGTALGNSDYTVAVVEKRAGGQTGRTRFFVSGNDTASPTDNKILMLGYDYLASNDLVIFGQNNNNYQYDIENFTSQVARIHIFRANNIGKKYKLNGQDRTSSLVAQSGADGTQRLISYNSAQIGRYQTATFYFGYIGEIIIFRKYLNEDETKNLEQYLNQKWNVY